MGERRRYEIRGPNGFRADCLDDGGGFMFHPGSLGEYEVRVSIVDKPKPLTFFGRELGKTSETRLELQTETFNVVSAKDVDGWYAGLRKGKCCSWSALSEAYNDPASALAALERICVSEFNFWDEVVPDGEWLDDHDDA